MIKKILVGIGIALLLLGGIYGIFLYNGNLDLLQNRIETYRRYGSIFFVSIILLYVFNGEKKLYKFLNFVIILINLFIIGDMFFKNNIGLNSQQFVMVFGLMLLGLAVTYIKHRIRILLMSIVGIGIIFVLLTGILPMYENIPNMDNFIQSQRPKIINQGAKEGKLTIKNILGSKELLIDELHTHDISLGETTQISFASKTMVDKEKIFIAIGNGTFIHLSPQSAITLETKEHTIYMEIIQGTIEYYTPIELSGTIHTVGKIEAKYIENINNTVRSNLIYNFEKQKKEYFINELGGNIVLYPVIDKVIYFFINTLYTINPKTYQNNLINYYTIQEYLGNTTETTQTTTGESLKSIVDDIMSQAKKGGEETMILKKIFK